MVVEGLLASLADGEWDVGSRLPSEREIGEKYGVSRTIVREALSALQLAGYIETRAGDGTYVLPEPTVPASPLNASVEAGLSVVEAIEAREAMDISAAHLAIENASDGDLARAAEVISQMQDAAGRLDFGTYIGLTLDFHIALAAAGGNGFIEQTVSFLIDQIRSSLWVVEQNYNRKVVQESLAVHEAIFAAVERRDLDAAIQAVRSHYRSYPSIRYPHQP